jgi:hypothetical protein
MHTYRPGNLRDEIPKEGGFGPPRAITPWKKKKKKKYSQIIVVIHMLYAPSLFIVLEWEIK